MQLNWKIKLSQNWISLSKILLYILLTDIRKIMMVPGARLSWIITEYPIKYKSQIYA